MSHRDKRLNFAPIRSSWLNKLDKEIRPKVCCYCNIIFSGREHETCPNCGTREFYHVMIGWFPLVPLVNWKSLPREVFKKYKKNISKTLFWARIFWSEKSEENLV